MEKKIKSINKKFVYLAIILLITVCINCSGSAKEIVKENKSIIAQDTSPLLITNVKGGFGIKMDISNYGETYLENIHWNVYVTGGIFGKIDKHFSGSINTLNPGETRKVFVGIVFGYSGIIIDMYVNNPDYEDNEAVPGQQIGFLTLI